MEHKLYVMELSDGAPKRLTKMELIETQPSRSPNGKEIVYTTWSDIDGGHLYKVSSKGGSPQKLTTTSAIYNTPIWDAKTNRIVFTKGSAQSFKNT
jgi:Tol biopolymer transport system component